MRVFFLPFVCLMALLGCAPPDLRAVSDGPAPVPDTCGAAGLASYLGQPVSALPAKGLWGSVRIIRPGMMVTMDYSAQRLNAHVDGSGIILALTCG